MMTRVRRLLAPLSALLAVGALGLASSCSSIPFMGGGIELEIRPMAGQNTQLHTLYIIVARNSQVSKEVRSGELDDLLNKDKIEHEYLSFRTYRPMEDDSWKLEFRGSDPPLVTYSDKGSSIYVDIGEDISGSGDIEYCVVVLGYFGSKGFKQVTINQTTLAAEVDQLIQIGPGQFTQTDG